MRCLHRLGRSEWRLPESWPEAQLTARVRRCRKPPPYSMPTLLWWVGQAVGAKRGSGQAGGVVEVGFHRRRHEGVAHRSGMLHLRARDQHSMSANLGAGRVVDTIVARYFEMPQWLTVAAFERIAPRIEFQDQAVACGLAGFELRTMPG